jgi:L-serine/L-threonine ammonia-lyase
MKSLHIQTPLLQSQCLNQQLNKNIYFKLEALQPSGSFKLRGIGHFCQTAHAQGATSFVASSGGNAVVAVAYAGMKLNCPTTIFIPKSSHPIYLDAIKSYGAKIIIGGETAQDAGEAATAFAKENTSTYIHPYDHPDIWHAHSTIIDEVANECIKPDAVIVSVGGGGLACGILEGMHRHHWTDVPFFAVETKGADVFAQSMKAKQPVTLTQITSLATSLGASYVAPKLLAWAETHPIHNIVVSDKTAESGSRAFAKDMRVLVELASGASLSLIYDAHPLIRDYQNILVIVCGGINTSHFHLSPQLHC